MTPQEYFYNSSDKFKVCETWSYAMVKLMFEFAEHYHYHEEGLKVMAKNSHNRGEVPVRSDAL